MERNRIIRIILHRGQGDSSDEEEDELLHNQSYSSSESENNDEQNGVEDDSTDYDRSLPAQHLYLGELDEEGGTNIHEEETTPLLPLHYVSKHVLFPEEILPMQIFNPHSISMLRSAFTSHTPVAVCTDLRDDHHFMDVPQRPSLQDLSPMGTTADIVACREDDDGGWFHGPRFIVKFRGRQRFRLLEVHKKLNGMMECKVEILCDDIMLPPPPLLLSCPLSISHSYNGSIHVARLPEATLHSIHQAELGRKALKMPSMRMSSCPAPGWVIQQYDFDYLREEVMKAQQLNRLTSDEGVSCQLPLDMTSLSYWLSRRLPVDNKTKFELLSINCPTTRLLLGLKILKENTELYCSECGSLITQKQFIFSMSVDGPLAAYVNEGGFVHETLTVTESYNLKRSGSGTTHNSWFPGYQWTIVHCKSCKDHKGWCFEAVKRNVVPAKFYGLRRQGLVFSVKKN